MIVWADSVLDRRTGKPDGLSEPVTKHRSDGAVTHKRPSFCFILTLSKQLLLTNRFPGLISRWRMRAECKYFNPVKKKNQNLIQMITIVAHSTISHESNTYREGSDREKLWCGRWRGAAAKRWSCANRSASVRWSRICCTQRKKKLSSCIQSGKWKNQIVHSQQRRNQFDSRVRCLLKPDYRLEHLISN